MTVRFPEAPPRPAAKSASVVREALKAFFRGVATVFVLPLLAVWWLESRLIGRDRALEYATEMLALYPGLTGRYLRRAFLIRVLAHCDPSAEIGFGVIFSKAGTSVDKNVYIGPRCHIGLAHLERDVLLAAGVHVTSGARTHGMSDPSKPIRDQEGTRELVRIGAGTWVGSAAVVMTDVGAGSVVGAGAVVSKPLPDNVVAAGVPARVLHSRTPDHPPGERNGRG
jgi:acetyltransferase-like isoleucine patch superfamily enzyme